MIRNATNNTTLLRWGIQGSALAVAALIAATPAASRAAPKAAAKKGTVVRDSSASNSAGKDAPTAADEGEKPAAEKAEAAAPAAGSIKLPEVYSTGYNGSYVDLIKFIDTQIRQGWIDNGIRPAAAADDGEWVRRVPVDNDE